jgi:hypothetical protein
MCFVSPLGINSGTHEEGNDMLRKFALLLGAVGAFALSQPAFADTPCCVVGAIVPDAGQNAASVSMGNYGGNNYLVWQDASNNLYIARYNAATHAYEGKIQLVMNGLGYNSFAIGGNSHGLYIALWVRPVQTVMVLQIQMNGATPTGAITGLSSAPWQASAPVGMVNINGDLYLYSAESSSGNNPPGFASVGTTSAKSTKK